MNPILVYETQKRVVRTLSTKAIFIKFDKKVFQRIRNNKSFEFRVIFKVFREENCQSMKDVFQAL